jgi:hypothetical protein
LNNKGSDARTGLPNTSWKIGKIAQLENEMLIRLRNAGFRMMPEALGKRQLEKLENVSF